MRVWERSTTSINNEEFPHHILKYSLNRKRLIRQAQISRPVKLLQTTLFNTMVLNPRGSPHACDLSTCSVRPACIFVILCNLARQHSHSYGKSRRAFTLPCGYACSQWSLPCQNWQCDKKYNGTNDGSLLGGGDRKSNLVSGTTDNIADCDCRNGAESGIPVDGRKTGQILTHAQNTKKRE